MRTSKVCPKCQSTDIIRVPGWVGGVGTGNNIPTRTFTLGAASYVLVARYVCAACGFSEEWIDNPSDITKLEQRYVSVKSD